MLYKGSTLPQPARPLEDQESHSVSRFCGNIPASTLSARLIRNGNGRLHIRMYGAEILE